MQEENLDCLNNLLNISWRDKKEFEEMDEEKIVSEIENLSDQNDSGMNVSSPNNQSTPKVLKTVEVNDKINKKLELTGIVEKIVTETENESDHNDSGLNAQKIQYTPTKILKSIEVNDKSVEVTGFIDEFLGTRSVGSEKQYKLYSFLINNNAGERCQVSAWNSDIDSIEKMVKLHAILHFDGACASAFKTPSWNAGTLPFELIIRSNTLVEYLGDHNPEIQKPTEAELYLLKDVAGKAGFIRIEAYVKTPFAQLEYTIKKTSTVVKYGIGSITDGTYKLEINIKNYDDYFYEIEKGNAVQIQGFLRKKGEMMKLHVMSIRDIKVLAEKPKMSFKSLIDGYKYL